MPSKSNGAILIHKLLLKLSQIYDIYSSSIYVGVVPAASRPMTFFMADSELAGSQISKSRWCRNSTPRYQLPALTLTARKVTA